MVVSLSGELKKIQECSNFVDGLQAHYYKHIVFFMPLPDKKDGSAH